MIDDWKVLVVVTVYEIPLIPLLFYTGDSIISLFVFLGYQFWLCGLFVTHAWIEEGVKKETIDCIELKWKRDLDAFYQLYIEGKVEK